MSEPQLSRKEVVFVQMDAMPAPLRQCVHEFGYPIVNAFVTCGIKNPAHIRHLVKECWDGARQTGNKPTTKNKVGNSIATLDWVLLQAGANVSASTLVRILRDHHMVIVPIEPSPAMVDASMDAVNHMGVVSKSTKHRNRLRAAIKAATKQFWPHLIHGGEAA